jgi:hypothetical protein
LQEALAVTKAASKQSVSKHDEESGGPEVVISDACDNNDQAISCENDGTTAKLKLTLDT